jgi:acetamidase/formamidase
MPTRRTPSERWSTTSPRRTISGREDAYLLRSLVVDLKISEIVEPGQYIFSTLLPEAVFGGP